jgi:hypothetical protein
MSEIENKEIQDLKKIVHELKSAINPMAERISDFPETQRRVFRRLVIPIYLVVFCLVMVIIFSYFKLSSRHVTFITEGETKTLIGVKGAGRIQANTDDRTGETIIEVYHAKN